MANPVGAPRTTCPSIEECVELGKDLVKWATEETKELRTAFCFWYSLKHGFLRSDWKLMKQKKEFRPYYEQARAALAKKMHTQELEKGMSHRYIRMYDRDLEEDENEQKKFDASLKLDDSKDDSAERIADAIEKLANKKEAL